MQSVPITTKVVSWSPVHGKVYSIQHYVIKFVSKVATGLWFSPVIQVSYNSKTDRQDITEILLKVALNIIHQTIQCKITGPFVIISTGSLIEWIHLSLRWFNFTYYF